MRIGVYGGTFDPIHIAHLVVAEQVRDSLNLDKIFFIPCASPPHKTLRIITSAAHRLEMVRLATVGDAAFIASDLEIKRGGLSYTVDTLEQILAQNAVREEDLFLIIGADSLAEMASWRSAGRIFELCRVVAVSRPNSDLRREFADFRKNAIRLNTPLLGISSSELRERVKAGESIHYLVPPKVEEYILKNELYKA